MVEKLHHILGKLIHLINSKLYIMNTFIPTNFFFKNHYIDG